jgi:hypothetical protein
MEVAAVGRAIAMNLPTPEVCQELRALHLLLGSSQLPEEQRDAFRQQLLELLAVHGLKWSDWPEFFATQNIVPSQPLPPVDSSKWKKHCEKARQLHAAMASTDKDGSVAYKKLIAEVAKQKFIWSSDLPAILAAHWIHHNPTVAGTAAAAPASSGPPEIDVFVLTKAVLEDRVVREGLGRALPGLQHAVTSPKNHTVTAILIAHMCITRRIEHAERTCTSPQFAP